MTAPIIAIDGGAGSGKSTLGRRLARALGLPYVSTGLMYRAVAAEAATRGVDRDDALGLEHIARGLRFKITGADPPVLEVEGWPGTSLATLEVDRTVSGVSRHPQVRAVLRQAQRDLGAGGAVMEGRDIGAVVFPDAVVKLHLVATAHDRVRRRAGERGVDDDDARDAVLERDRRDVTTTPDTPAPGAVVIDTSDLSADETLRRALDEVRRAAPELAP